MVRQGWAHVIHVIGRAAPNQNSSIWSENSETFQHATGHELVFLNCCWSLAPGKILTLQTPVLALLGYEGLVQDEDAFSYACQIYDHLSDAQSFGTAAVQQALKNLKRGPKGSEFPQPLNCATAGQGNHPWNFCLCRVFAVGVVALACALAVRLPCEDQLTDVMRCPGICLVGRRLDAWVPQMAARWRSDYSCVSEKIKKKTSRSHWEICGSEIIMAHLYTTGAQFEATIEKITTDCNVRTSRKGFLVPPYADWEDYRRFYKFVLEFFREDEISPRPPSLGFFAKCFNTTREAEYVEVSLEMVDFFLVQSGLVQEFGFLPPCPKSSKRSCEFTYHLNLPKVRAMYWEEVPVPPGALWVAIRLLTSAEGKISSTHDGVYYRRVDGGWLNYTSLVSKTISRNASGPSGQCEIVKKCKSVQ